MTPAKRAPRERRSEPPARRRAARAGPPADVLTYRVSYSPTNKLGQLLSLSVSGRVVPRGEYGARPCWEYLQNRPSPCIECPVFGKSPNSEPWSLLRVGASGPFQLVEASKRGTEAEVRIIQLSDAVVTALCKEKLHRLAVLARLSMQETRVLELMTTGCQTKEIANMLGISARTAKFHGTNLLRKIGADSRLALLRLMITPERVPQPD
jgi:DNA-binding CsgD family transcriptional regulator